MASTRRDFKPTIATVTQLEDLESRVTDSLMAVLARIELLEFALTNVINDVYESEAAEVDAPDYDRLGQEHRDAMADAEAANEYDGDHTVPKSELRDGFGGIV